jgi:hypothetical protein
LPDPKFDTVPPRAEEGSYILAQLQYRKVGIEGLRLLAPDIRKGVAYTAPDRRLAFATYALDGGVVLGSPSLLGRIEADTFWWLQESYDYDQFDIQFEALLGELAGRAITRHHLPGQWCVLNSKWATNLYHWLIETLPKILFMEGAGYDGSYMVPDLPLALLTMAALGVPAGRIRAALPHGNFDRMLVADTLVVPDRINATKEGALLGDALRRLRAALVAAARPPGRKRRLYIGRRGTRRVVNEDALMEILARHGFERVYMEDIDIMEQIATAREAEAIIGPHGAGMTHMLFAEPNAFVMELTTFHHGNPLLVNLARIMDHEYFMIPSEPTELANIQAPLDVIALILSKRL